MQAWFSCSHPALRRTSNEDSCAIIAQRALTVLRQEGAEDFHCEVTHVAASIEAVQTPDLRTQIGSLTLQNPVIAASGTCGYGEELHPFVDLDSLGAVSVKGLSLTPTRGNPAPRLTETAGGMLNSVGLQNIGIAAFIAQKLPALRQHTRTKIIVNFFGDSPADYAAVAERASDAEGIAALEANISCPNVQHGGMLFSSDPRSTFQVVERVRKVTALPLIVKLSPNVTDITVIARAAEEAGADAVSLINTLLGMAIDLDTRTPRLPLGTGGLSGPAIKPVALRMVWQVAQAVRIPVIGLGGITTGEDALEFLVAGAKACQVGTASFVDPAACRKIIQEMRRYLQRHQIATAAELCGTLRFQSLQD